MRTCLSILVLALSACRASSVPPPPELTAPPVATAPHAAPLAASSSAPRVVVGGLLPPATKPLVLRQTATDPPTLLDLVHQLQDSTGVGFILTEDTMATLGRTPTGLRGELEVSADQAWRVVETILVRNEFVLAPRRAARRNSSRSCL